MSTPRVALVSPYWSFWEASVAGDLRADRRTLAADVVAALDEVEIVADETVDSRAAGEEAARRIRKAGADALVVVQSMAVPPSYTMATLDRLPGLPLVVLAVQRARAIGDGFAHGDITQEGASVGTPQLTNVLHRRGRPHDVVVGSLADDGLERRVRAAVAVAAAAGRFRRARLGRVGTPIDGYECVDAEDDALRQALGVEVVRIRPVAIQAAYRAADAGRIAEIEGEVRTSWTLGAGVEDDECLARSLRAAAALEALDAELALDAGAMNCHVPEIRFAEEPGITPCFALGRETSRGIPWSCAGDVVTAVAMLATKLLGGAALYHELEALDHKTDEAVIANSGEHDLACANPDAPPELRRNLWFDGVDPRCGACACFSLRPGPGTLVGFTPHPEEPSGFRFVVAEGELTARRFPATGTANGAFRFAGGHPVAEMWEAWVRAGVNHHSSATPGLFGDAVERLARHLGVGCVRVS